ncbi:hypothetical protein HK102_003954 [Quaeritorhiza haematococci]|nr:hypothetical protein HK102_003954 [Quaeritorhiza haematococci]
MTSTVWLNKSPDNSIQGGYVSVDVVFCEDGALQKLPLAFVDVHGSLPIGDNKWKCLKAVVSAFASTAFYILVHVSPHSLRDLDHARSLMKVLKKGFTEYGHNPAHIDMPIIDFVLWTSNDCDEQQFLDALDQLEKLQKELSDIFSEIVSSYEIMKTGVAEDRWTLLLPPMQDFYALYQKVGEAYELPTAYYKQRFGEHEDFLRTIEVRISQYFDKVLGMSSVSAAAHQWSFIFKASQIDTEIADLEQFMIGGSMQQWRPKNCRSEADVLRAITEKRQQFNKLHGIQFPTGSDLSIDISACWREVIVLSKVDDGQLLKSTFQLTVEEVEKAFAKWVRGGEPIQFMSGRSWYLDIDFLRGVFSQLSGPEADLPKADLTSSVFVIGQQSTGKSTLLNCLFGCGFAVSGGRCTRGLYLSYRWTEYEGKLVHLILNDSEGLSSVEKQAADHAAAKKKGQTTNSSQVSPNTAKAENSESEDVGIQSFAGSGTFDRIMTLLALTVSPVVLINHKGELNTGITNILDVCIYHMESVQMQTANIKPNLLFVLRDIAQTAGGLKRDEVYEHIEEHLKKLPSMPENRDEQMLSIAEDSVHLMTAAYRTEIDDFNVVQNANGGPSRIVSPNLVFGEEVAVVRANIVIIANAKYLYLPNHALIGQCRNSVAIAWGLQKQLETKMSNLKTDVIGEINKKKTHYSARFESRAQEILDELNALFRGKVDANWGSIAIDEGEKILRSTWEFQRRLIADKLTREQLRHEARESIRDLLQKHIKETTGGEEGDLEATLAFNKEWQKIEEKTQKFIKSIYSGEGDISILVVKLFNMSIDGLISSGSHSSTESITAEKKNDTVFQSKFFKSLNKNDVLVEYSDKSGGMQQSRIQQFKRFAKKYSPWHRPDEEEIEAKLRDIAASYQKEVRSMIDDGETLKPDQMLVDRWLGTFCQRLFEVMSEMGVAPVVEKYGALIDPLHHDLRRKVFEGYVSKCNNWEKVQQAESNNNKNRLYDDFIGIAMATNNKMLGSRFDWKDPERATKAAYEASFGVLDYQNIKAFIKDPEGHIKKTFEAKFDTVTNRSVQKWTNVVVKLHESFSQKVRTILTSTSQPSSDEVTVTQELSQELAAEFNTILQTRDELKPLETITPNVLAGIFGVIKITNVREFATSAIEEFNKQSAGSYFTQPNVQKWIEAAIKKKKPDLLKRAVGCTARCPFCGAKCSHLGTDDDKHIHQVGQHYLGAFSGWSSIRLKENDTINRGTSLVSGSEAAFMHSNCFTSKSEETLPLQDYVKERHPRWSPLWVMICSVTCRTAAESAPGLTLRPKTKIFKPRLCDDEDWFIDISKRFFKQPKHPRLSKS